MTERLLTPSKITAFLDCEHYLTLKHRVDSGQLAVENPFGSFARLLMDKGLEHEQACLAHYRSEGKSVYEVPARYEHETFALWVARIGNPMDGDYDVIYQMPFIHDGVRGVADFLERVVDDDGVVRWEPVDAKLARKEAKPGHVLQLCFYADARQEDPIAASRSRARRGGRNPWLRPDECGRPQYLADAHTAGTAMGCPRAISRRKPDRAMARRSHESGSKTVEDPTRPVRMSVLSRSPRPTFTAVAGVNFLLEEQPITTCPRQFRPRH